MRRLIASLSVLVLAACATKPPTAREIPIEAIRETLRAECEDQGLNAIDVAIALPGDGEPEVVEISWGKVHNAAGALVDPAGMLWTPNDPGEYVQHGEDDQGASEYRIVHVVRNADVEKTVLGRYWWYGVPAIPATASVRTIGSLSYNGFVTMSLEGLARSALLDHAWWEVRGPDPRQSDAFYLGNSIEITTLDSLRMYIVAATDLAPAHAPLQRVSQHIAALLRGESDQGNRPPLERADRATTRKITGSYTTSGKNLEILELDGEPWLVPDSGTWMRLRGAGADRFVARDLLHVDVPVHCDGKVVELDGEVYARRNTAAAELPPELHTLLGRYHETSFGLPLPDAVALERHAEFRMILPADLVEREVPYQELHLSDGDRVEVDTFDLQRANDSAGTFHIQPVHSRDELHALADAATPPAPAPDALPFDLVELRDLDPTIHYDIRYATDNNFMGFPLYDEARARMQRPAAEAVARAHRELGKLGYGIVVHDAWRPWRVTKMFWDATPENQHTFVADPSHGSRHNRGCAIDLSLYELATGKVVEMPSGYDEFTERAYPCWPGGTSQARARRDLLRRKMEDQGFTVYEAEWWHFDFHDWQRYPVK